MTDQLLVPTTDWGSIAQVVLGLATLVNSMLLWPIVKKLRANDERQDERLDHLEGPKRKSRARVRKR